MRDSDATLVLLRSEPRGGTAGTVRCAQETGRPLRIVRLGAQDEPLETRLWLATLGAATLNIAGPRESEDPGIGAASRSWLDLLLDGVHPYSPREHP